MPTCRILLFCKGSNSVWSLILYIQKPETHDLQGKQLMSMLLYLEDVSYYLKEFLIYTFWIYIFLYLHTLQEICKENFRKRL